MRPHDEVLPSVHSSRLSSTLRSSPSRLPSVPLRSSPFPSQFRSSTAPASGDGQQLLQHPTALAHSRRQKQGLQPRPDSVTDSESSDLESGVTSPLTFSALETKSNGHSSTSSSSMPALPNYEMLFATGDGSAGAAADSEAGLGGGAGGGVGVGFADGRRERRHGADGDEDGLGDASSQMLGMLAARPQSDAQEDAYLASRTQAVQNIRSTIEEVRGATRGASHSSARHRIGTRDSTRLLTGYGLFAFSPLLSWR